MSSRYFIDVQITIVIFLWLFCTNTHAQEIQARLAPNFAGVSIPSYQTAWVPPVPSSPIIEATEALHDEGFPSPIGGEYRSITIPVGSLWGYDGHEETVRGWLMPFDPNERGRFAVCWNGLVYPVLAIGPTASLDNDVNDLVMGKQLRREDALSDDRTTIESYDYPLKCCLLYLDNRPDLAAKFWNWEGSHPRLTFGDSTLDQTDPYLWLATDWTWSLYDRAVNAHTRGDDHLSLIAAQYLQRVAPQIEEEASSRGFTRSTYLYSERQTGPIPYLYFLGPLPVLLADEQERLTESPRTPALQLGLNHFPSKASRIAALIQDLNDISALPHTIPGDVNLETEPTVQALIAQGEDAVPSLLDTLIYDDRLTRSSHETHEMRQWIPVTVAEAAYVALCGILRTNFLGATSTEEDFPSHFEQRTEIAADIRNYWLRHRNVPPPKR